MALSKADKHALASSYAEHFADAKNVIVIKQEGLPVNAMNALRKDVTRNNGMLKVVKKRLLLKSLEHTSLEMIELETLQDSVAVLCAYDDEYAPLKAVNNHNKSYTKDKHEYGFTYVGGRFSNEWKDAEHVSVLANIPSQEELISKLLYLIKYPLQSLAVVTNAIAQKSGDENTLVKDLIASDTQE
jgi:large subunit ribosomal protein L10